MPCECRRLESSLAFCYKGKVRRDNWLSNRIFKSYQDILDHCFYAWNKLVDQPWLIMSIGTR